MPPRILVLAFVAGCWSSVLAQGSGSPDDGLSDSFDLDAGEFVEFVPPPQPVSPDTLPRPKREEYRYPYSFTISPLHLAALLSVEAMLERMLTPHSSLAVIAGVGTLPTGFGLTDQSGIDLQEIGAQLRYYPRKPGRWNPHVGLEGFWGRVVVRMSPEDDDTWLSAIFDGEYMALGGGGFFGTKFVGKDGVTIEVQGGYQVIRLANREGTADYLPVPILNLNIGKSW